MQLSPVLLSPEEYAERRDHLIALCATDDNVVDRPKLEVNKLYSGDGRLWYQVDEKYPCRHADTRLGLFEQIATEVTFHEWDLDRVNEECYSEKNHRDEIIVVE